MEHLTEKEQIEWLQRYILVHSWIYYYGNDSLISDRQYDKKAKELVDMQSGYAKLGQTQYGYVFHDFDGNTGFDLHDRLNDKDKEHITHIVRHVMKLAHGEIGKKKKQGRTST